jgi:hypothetical protein
MCRHSLWNEYSVTPSFHIRYGATIDDRELQNVMVPKDRVLKRFTQNFSVFFSDFVIGTDTWLYGHTRVQCHNIISGEGGRESEGDIRKKELLISVVLDSSPLQVFNCHNCEKAYRYSGYERCLRNKELQF